MFLFQSVAMATSSFHGQIICLLSVLAFNKLCVCWEKWKLVISAVSLEIFDYFYRKFY